MRHRNKGRKLGRNPNHQRALLRNLAAALFLTERQAEGEPNAPKTRGRIITTLAKAKEVRPLVEKCVTIARRALVHQVEADRLKPDVDRYTEAWRAWRSSPEWREWAQAMAPVVAARRRVLQLVGNKQAVRVLFDELAPRFEERQGGYTRILQLAKPRRGDSAPRAVLEFVGVRDRTRRKAQRPTIEAEPESTSAPSALPPDAAPEPAAQP
ncbi:MAG: bL17 family ribosomal protein [Thermoguttaceae bacterium]|jgi:large subunit ribosomal protein L17|nr:bL17 family ribosomal protein [Thermoguttaceae bacterium]